MTPEQREAIIDYMDNLVLEKLMAQNNEKSVLAGGTWDRLFNKVVDYTEAVLGH